MYGKKDELMGGWSSSGKTRKKKKRDEEFFIFIFKLKTKVVLVNGLVCER